jgi:ABC-type glutathione transport system ATPase component
MSATMTPAETAAASAQGAADAPAPGGPLLTVKDLQVYFPILTGVLRRRTGWVRAVDGVSFHIDRGETLGLVGESGSGKTTIGRTIVRITQPLAGSIDLGGVDLLALKGDDLRRRRRRFQMVFQDPYSSLDPRQTVGEILAEPLRVHNLAAGKAREARVAELLDLVGLDTSFVERYPHEFSGGQRQRIAIARAILADPRILILDEATSSLDSESEAFIQDGLRRLRQGRTTFVIAHRLSTIRSADQILVLEHGKIVERGNHAALMTLGGRYRQLHDRQYNWEQDRFINPGEDFTPAPEPAAAGPTAAARPDRPL